VDLSTEQQMDIPFVRFVLNRSAIARAGLPAEDVAEAVETSFAGATVGRIFDRGTAFDLVVKFDAQHSVDFDRVAVDASDLTIWVADCCGGGVVHLREWIDHSVALLATSLESFSQPEGLWVDPSNPTCWVTDAPGDRVVQLDPAGGATRASLEGLVGPSGVSGDAAAGTLWVLSRGGGALTRATTAGTPLRTDFVVNRPRAISAGTGSVWVHGQSGQAMRLGRDGTVLATVEGSYAGRSVATDPVDNSCWLADCCYSRVLHVDAEGHLLSEPRCLGDEELALDATDGSCW
jgi:DNA-binding beta-propeller fold protein YncE